MLDVIGIRDNRCERRGCECRRRTTTSCALDSRHGHFARLDMHDDNREYRWQGLRHYECSRASLSLVCLVEQSESDQFRPKFGTYVWTYQ